MRRRGFRGKRDAALVSPEELERISDDSGAVVGRSHERAVIRADQVVRDVVGIVLARQPGHRARQHVQTVVGLRCRVAQVSQSVVVHVTLIGIGEFIQPVQTAIGRGNVAVQACSNIYDIFHDVLKR